MSCASNSNRGKLAAIACGVSKLGSSAAYTAAAVGGGAAGGVAGAALGSLVGPPGMVIGGAVGGAAGATVAVKGATTLLNERRWRKSETGGQARRTRDRAVEDARSTYQAQTAKLSIQRKYHKQKFKDARDAGVASLSTDKKDTAKVVGKVAARAAGAAALKTGAAMLRQYHPDPNADRYLRQKVTTATARKEVLQQAGGFTEQIEQEQTNRWLQTPGGQKAQAAYRRQLRQLTVKQAKHKQVYDARVRQAETAYSRQREDFLTGA